VILLQHRQPLAGPESDRTFGTVHLAAENFKKGRFTGAIGANDPVTIAGSKFYIDILE
jgi:hypothetical protein